jgi:dolichol-phosphate mannosyltransferase
MKLIIPRISEVLNDNNLLHEILVIDDDSPDGTAGVASGLASRYSVRVHLRKNERGLASAVMEGFELAKGEIVVVMDADMSHPVEMLPTMIRPITDGTFEATVGTRYGEGGGVENWPWFRRWISQGAGFLARGVTNLSDPTSGYMAIRKDLLEGVELDPVGWKIVLETVVKAKPFLKEVPISFADRIEGESKLSLRAQLDYLRHLWKLYGYRYRDAFMFLGFCTVGFTGMIIDTGILVSLVELLALDPRAAAAFAFTGAVTWNFGWNQRWTFSGIEFSKNVYSRYASFFLFCLLGLGVRIGVMHLLIRYTVLGHGRGYILASLLGIVAGTLINFLGSRNVSFSPKSARS